MQHGVSDNNPELMGKGLVLSGCSFIDPHSHLKGLLWEPGISDTL